jgi:hypothetical protein
MLCFYNSAVLADRTFPILRQPTVALQWIIFWPPLGYGCNCSPLAAQLKVGSFLNMRPLSRRYLEPWILYLGDEAHTSKFLSVPLLDNNTFSHPCKNSW